MANRGGRTGALHCRRGAGARCGCIAVAAEDAALGLSALACRTITADYPLRPNLAGGVAGGVRPGGRGGRRDCPSCAVGPWGWSSSSSWCRRWTAPWFWRRPRGRPPRQSPCPRWRRPSSRRRATAAPAGARCRAASSAPGGPYLYDSQGRVVFFHGVDAVYKYAPYELYPDPGKPWNFSAADASLMARLGFNVVRLGMTWSGLEPGTAPANDPAICEHGTADESAPVQPGRARPLRGAADQDGRTCWGASTSTRSWTCTRTCTTRCSRVRARRAGPCAPTACRASTRPAAGPSSTRTKAAGIAFHHFWDNNVRGDLQGQYDQVWGDVAHAFKGNRWVLGYDPFNEPFSTSLIRFGDEHFDSQLECFYTGTAHIGTPSHGAPPLRCPADDPANGVVPTILANDPGHLIFDEPDNYASRGLPTYIGPDGPAQPRLQRPRLLRCPQPGDREPDQHRGVRRPGRAFTGRAGVGPSRDGVGRATEGAGLVRHRVRRQAATPPSSRPSRRRWTRNRSDGPTGPGNTTGTPPGVRPSPSSWPTDSCARPPAS